MLKIKSSDIFTRHETRQFNGQQIADKLIESRYVYNIPNNHVSSAGLTKNDIIEKLNKFSACGSVLSVAEYADGQTIASNSNYCNLLICWTCAARKERRRYARIRHKINEAINKYKYAYHVIFTIKDGPDVRERSEFLRLSLKRWRKKRNGEYLKSKAALFSQEIKDGKNSHEYHTHTHAIIWTDEQLDYSVYDKAKKTELINRYGFGLIPKSELQKIEKSNYIDSKGQSKGCSKLSREWIEATDGQGEDIEARPILSAIDYKKAVKEVIKYATKLNRNEPNRAAEILTNCQGLRFFSTAKKMRYNIKAGETPPAPIRRTDKPESIHNFQWNKKEKRYVNWKPSRDLFDVQDPAKKPYQSRTAILLGEYRKARNQLIKGPAPEKPLFYLLDKLKEHYRKRVKMIWQGYERKRWTPYGAYKITEKCKLSASYLQGYTKSWIEMYSGIEPLPAPP